MKDTVRLCSDSLSPADLILNVKIYYKKITSFSFTHSNLLMSIMQLAAWKINSSYSNQVISCTLWTQIIIMFTAAHQYCSQSWDRLPVNSLPFYFFKTHFNIILPIMLGSWKYLQSHSCPHHEGMYGEIKVHLHSILTLALATLPMEKNPSIYRTGGCAVPRDSLDLFRKTKSSCFSQEWKPGSSSPQPSSYWSTT